jgi:nickel-dependent lactate racemase
MGIGEESFLNLLSKANSSDEVFGLLDNEYKLGYQKAAKMAQIGCWAQIWAVTDLEDNIIKKSLMKPYNNLQSAIDDAISIINKKGEKPKIIIMPSGSLTVPFM